MRRSKKASSIRRGFEYQDHVGALKVLEMLDHPGQPQVWLESDDGIHVDDIRVDNGQVVEWYQVKFSTASDDEVSFGSLLEHPGGKQTRRSIWQKFADSWRRLHAGSPSRPIELHLYSNRGAASGDLASVIDPETGRLDSQALAGSNLATIHSDLLRESGLQPAEFARFLSSLRFDLNEYSEHEMPRQVQLRLRVVGSNADQYERLMRQCADWAIRRTAPITKHDVRMVLELWWQSYDPLDQTFPVDRERFVPNETLVRSVDELVDGLTCGYIVLTGRPGSGKSTFLANYAEHSTGDLQRPTVDYYCFTDVSDPRTQERTLAQSFIQSVSYRLRAISRDDTLQGRSPHDVASLMDVLGQVASQVAGRAQKLVLILDGLDHALRSRSTGTGSLVEVLPASLPPNVVFIVGTQPRNDLPAFLRSPLLPREQVREVRGFSADQVTAYLRLSGVELDRQQPRADLRGSDFVRLVMERSDGLPIYVRYVVERMRHEQPRDPLKWLRQLPSVTDGISTYYATLWPDLKPVHRSIVICLCCCRFAVSADELHEILDEASAITRYDVEEAIEAARHLLVDVGEGRWRICHDSLSEFVRQNHASDVTRSLKAVYDYLRARPAAEVTRVHLLTYAASAGDWPYVLDCCDVDYVDTKMIEGRPHWEIDSDIRLAVEAAGHVRDVASLLRCGLLGALHQLRRQFSIDEGLYCRTLVRTGRASSAIHYVTHRDWLTVSPNVALQVGAELASHGFTVEARHVLRAVDASLRTWEEAWQGTEIGLWLLLRVLCGGNLASALDHLNGISWHTDTDGRRQALRTQLLRWLTDRSEVTILRQALDADLAADATARGDIHLALAGVLAGRGDSEEALRVLAALGDCGPDPVECAWIRARCQQDPSELAGVIDDCSVAPPLDYGAYPDDAQIAHRAARFGRWVAVLGYCHRGEEVDALRHTCQGQVSPIGTALAAVMGLWQQVGQIWRGDGDSQIASALERCVSVLDVDAGAWRGRNHGWAEEQAARALLQQELPAVASALVQAEVQTAPGVLDFVARAGDTRLVTVEAVFGVLDSALPRVDTASAGDCLQAAADAFVLSEPVMETRANLWLRLACLASSCQLDTMAQHFLREAVQTGSGYGFHKDFRLLHLVNGLGELKGAECTGVLGRLARCAEMLRWLATMTDQDEVDYIAETLVALVFAVCPQAGRSLYWAFADDPEFDSMFHADNALIEISQDLAAKQPDIAAALLHLICDTKARSMEERTRALLHVLDVAHGEATHLYEKARAWMRVELSDDQEGALAALNATATGAGTATWRDYVRGRSDQTPDLGVRETVTLYGRDVDAEAVRQMVQRGVSEAENVVRELPEAPPHGFERAVGDGLIALCACIADGADVVRVRDVIEGSVELSSRADVWRALGDAAERVGPPDAFVDCMRRAHREGRAWTQTWTTTGLGPFMALAAWDVAAARDFLYEDLASELSEHWWTATSALIPLIKACRAVGLADDVPRLVETFEEHCCHLFRKVALCPERYAWMTDAVGESETSREQAAMGLMVDHFAHPEVDVMTAAVQAVLELWPRVPELVAPQIRDSLHSEDYHRRSKAAIVCHALSLERFDLLRDVLGDLVALHGDDAIDIADAARETLRQIADADSEAVTPSDLSAAERLWSPAVRQPRPSGLTVPRAAVGADTVALLGPIQDDIESVARRLGVDADDFHGQVIARMLALGYDEDRATESRRRLMYRYSHGNFDGMVLFEDYALSLGRQAICEVSRNAVTVSDASAGDIGAVLSHLRRYDPDLVSETPNPRPADMSFPGSELPDGEWIHFGDDPEQVSDCVPDGDMTICERSDLCQRTEGRIRRRRHLATWAILSTPSESEALTRRWIEGQRIPFALQVPQSRDEGMLRIDETRRRIERCAIPVRGAFLPLVQMQLVRWWYGASRELQTLAGWAIAELGLTWDGPHGLALRRNGERVCTPQWWAEGRSRTPYDRSRANEGQRLLCSSELLRELCEPLGANVVWLHAEQRELVDSIRSDVTATSDRRTAGVWRLDG